MSISSVLLVDDDDVLRFTLTKVLELHGFEVTAAATVSDALKHISARSFDVLLSDLHMPGAGDGLTVVSAMRHANPKAVTMLLTAFPEMNAATHAILMQADEILVKPMRVEALVEAIKQRLATGLPSTRIIETVAAILERTVGITTTSWYERVELEPKITAVPLSMDLRCRHLPLLLSDLVHRLHSHKQLGSKEIISEAAAQHGIDRYNQGYTAAMLVEESRMLQVSLFQTLQDNLKSIDFSVLLIGVMTIADEVDSQLSQTMSSFIERSAYSAVPELVA